MIRWMNLRLERPPKRRRPAASRPRSRSAPEQEDDGLTLEKLEKLAVRLLRATPDVCLDGQDGERSLLLEIGRTARHFGGEAALVAKMRELGERLGFRTAIGVAETPEAARVLARAELLGEARSATPDEDLLRSLTPLPWQALAPPAAIADTLAFLGVHTIGELLALPRAGLATRTSGAFVQQLQRMLGELPEALERIVPPYRFEQSLELDVDASGAATQAGPLLLAARHLFEAAQKELEGLGRALVSATVTFVPLGRESPLAIELAPSEPTREARLLVRLLEHRLERERLAAPIEQVKLAFDHVVELAAAQDALFEDARDRDLRHDVAALRDRLAVRLGNDRVLAAELVADHRPERAFRFCEHASGAANAGRTSPSSAAHAPAGPRPLELDREPRPVLVETDDCARPRTLRDGGRAFPLRVLRGPERIASGWWDGHDVERDYFEVETEAGIRLWLFHDLKKDARAPTSSHEWFRHGAFS